MGYGPPVLPSASGGSLRAPHPPRKAPDARPDRGAGLEEPDIDRRPSPLAALGALLVLALGACAHDYAVERRDTPVHVWVSAPELGRAGGSVEALVYVGAQKAVEGTLRFPAGTSTVILPTLRTTEGSAHVQAVFAGGAVTAAEDVRVRGDTWIQITLTGQTATIRATSEQPPIPR